MKNKALISAVGVSLAVLLTNQVNTETDYVSFILENETVMNTDEYKRLYEKDFNKCVERKLEVEKLRECDLQSKYNAIKKLSRQ